MTLPDALREAATGSAAPAWTRVVLERMADDRPDDLERLVADPHLLSAVVAVTGLSNSLTRLLETDPVALDVLSRLDRRRPRTADDDLVRWKQRELLRIAARDQLGIDRLAQTGVLLSALATEVTVGAMREAGAEDRLVVVGMGKLGAYELNYASDIDVMFVCRDGDDPHGLEAAVRSVLASAGSCFRVDANLRPEGRNGPLVRTVGSYREYWSEWAAPWERQALLKARPIAGPDDLATEMATAITDAVWGQPLAADELRSLREMKARSEAEVARRPDGAREVKRGPGGIRDVEFSIQLLQLVHGHHDPALREPNTLVAASELADAGYVDPADIDRLIEAYEFLRALEHRMQLVEEQAVYALPTATAARARLGRAMGFRDTAERGAPEALDEELSRHRSEVRTVHQRLYFRPLLEAFADAPGAMSEAAVATRLTAFGFTDARRTREAARELTKGLTRSSRLMQQLLPLLLEWLSSTPDPDLGLLGLRKITSGRQRTAAMTQAFRESPETARRLCVLLGTSALLGRHLHHNPDLAARLADDELLRPRDHDELVAGATKALAWREHDRIVRQRGLQRFTDKEGLRLMAGDVLGVIEPPEIGPALTTLAEAVLQAAIDELEPQVPFAVVAMGRFGGAELSYASDLDVIFVHGDHGGGDTTAEALRVATELLRFLKGSTPAHRVYDVDADLRPEGRDGLLSRTVEGYVSYFDRWAQAWERQAFVRARHAAGDPGLAGELLSTLEPSLWDAPMTDDDLREIRRLKARGERERIPTGEDPEFHLKLGRGALTDIEFAVQLQQLQHRVHGTGTLQALHALVEVGAVSDADAEVLEAAWRFCDHARNRLHLVHGTSLDALPARNEQLEALARSLDHTPTTLREEYRRLTRRSRRVVERLFYGQG